MSSSAADGFTLIELLIAMVVGGMMLAVVATALVLGLQTTGQTSESIETSASVQFASSWFLTDVHSAEDVGGGGCGVSGALGTFTWGGDNPSTAVWYRVEDRVLREQCGSVPVPRHTVLTGVENPGISCEDTTCTLEWTSAGQDGRSRLTVTRRTGS